MASTSAKMVIAEKEKEAAAAAAKTSTTATQQRSTISLRHGIFSNDTLLCTGTTPPPPPLTTGDDSVSAAVVTMTTTTRNNNDDDAVAGILHEIKQGMDDSSTTMTTAASASAATKKNDGTTNTTSNAASMVHTSTSTSSTIVPQNDSVARLRLLQESAAELKLAARAMHATSALLLPPLDDDDHSNSNDSNNSNNDSNNPAAAAAVVDPAVVIVVENRVQNVVVDATTLPLMSDHPEKEDDDGEPRPEPPRRWTTILLGGKPIDLFRPWWFPSSGQNGADSSNDNVINKNNKQPSGSVGGFSLNGQRRRSDSTTKSSWKGRGSGDEKDHFTTATSQQLESPDDAFFSTDIQPGVPTKEIQGAALAGFCTAVAVLSSGGQFDNSDGVVPLTLIAAPAVAAYLAVTRGSAGDLTRAVGELAWDAARLAVTLYREMDAQGRWPHQVLDGTRWLAATAARGTQRKAREAAAVWRAHEALEVQRERQVRSERNARALLTARLRWDSEARTKRAAAAELEGRAERARQERERGGAERRQKEAVRVKARQDIMRYRFELEAAQRKRNLVAKHEAKKRVVQQMRFEMEKTSNKRKEEAEARRQREEAQLVERTQLKDKIRTSLFLSLKKSKQVIWANLARRANQMKHFLDNCAGGVLTTRYTLVQRASAYLIAASAPLFVMMMTMQQQKSEDVDTTTTVETTQG